MVSFLQLANFFHYIEKDCIASLGSTVLVTRMIFSAQNGKQLQPFWKGEKKKLVFAIFVL